MNDKKLKILFLVPSFPRISETFIINQIIDLIDQGHVVHVFTTEKSLDKTHPKVTEYKLLENVFYSDYPVDLASRLKCLSQTLLETGFKNKLRLLKTLNIFKYGTSASKLTQFFKIKWLVNTSDDYDIVHAHFGAMSDYYFEAKDCGFLKEAKLITTFHGYDIIPNDRNKNKKLYKKLIKNNIQLTANTEYTATLLQDIGAQTENIHILPVGLDTKYFENNSTKKIEEKINILFCGRIIKFKGVSRIADIANILINKFGHKNVNFNIIGESGESDDDELNTLLDKIKAYHLEKHFQLLGSQTQNKVIEIMCNSDIYIMPGITNVDGRAENQGLVIQEAQALKVPVVVTTAGGMKYGIKNNFTGFVVDEYDLDDFSKKIETLIINPKLREKMGNNGRDFIVKNYDSKFLGTQLVSLYNHVL